MVNVYRYPGWIYEVYFFVTDSESLSESRNILRSPWIRVRNTARMYSERERQQGFYYIHSTVILTMQYRTVYTVQYWHDDN